MERKYSVHEELGKGSFAVVKQATDRSTNQPCAVKILNIPGDSGVVPDKTGGYNRSLRKVMDPEDAKREAKVWKKVSGHPNVVELFQVSATKGTTFFVMEQCKGTLSDKVEPEEHVFSAAELHELFTSLLHGLQHMHSLRIAHRDIKPQNLLFGLSGVLKICDFGCADFEPKCGWFPFGTVGTPRYMSPEMVQEKKYDRKTDVWSAGVIMFRLVFGRDPYECEDAADLKRYIAIDLPKLTYTPRRGFEVPAPEAAEFVKQVLVRNDRKRPTAEACLALDFLQQATCLKRVPSDAPKVPEVDMDGQSTSGSTRLKDSPTSTRSALTSGGIPPSLRPQSPDASVGSG